MIILDGIIIMNKFYYMIVGFDEYFNNLVMWEWRVMVEFRYR